MFSDLFHRQNFPIWISSALILAVGSYLACSASGTKSGSSWWAPGHSVPPRALKFQRTFGSPGSGPGQFLNPQGISVDPEGNIYVADTGNHRVQKFDSAGRPIEEIGGFGWGEGRFNRPTGLSAREGLNIYVVDSQNRRVQRFDRYLNFLSSIPPSTEEEEPLAFGFLRDIEMAPTGELYVSDEENEQVLILTSFGELERSFGGFTSAADRLRTPAGLTIGRGSAVFVADTGNDRIARYDAFGSFLGSIGQGLLKGPKGVATDGQGYLYVADTGHDRICVFSSQGELLFSLGAAGTGYGSFHSPIDLAVSGTDLLCVLDSGNGRVQIFQIVRRAETEGL